MTSTRLVSLYITLLCRDTNYLFSRPVFYGSLAVFVVVQYNNIIIMIVICIVIIVTVITTYYNIITISRLRFSFHRTVDRHAAVFGLFSFCPSTHLDQRDIGDTEREQQREQPHPERVRELRRRLVPGRRDETGTRRQRDRQANVAAVASHTDAAAVGPALRPAVRGQHQVVPRRPSAQQLRAAVPAIVAHRAHQSHLPEPHRRPGDITFTRVFAF